MERVSATKAAKRFLTSMVWGLLLTVLVVARAVALLVFLILLMVGVESRHAYQDEV